MSKKEEVFLNQIAANGGDCFEFDNEDDLVAAIDSKCRMIALGDETRFVIRDDKGWPRYLRRRDAETELAQFQLVTEIERKDGSTKTEFRFGFPLWLKSTNRCVKYERRIFNPNVNEVGLNDLNMWTGFAIQPAQGDWSLLRAHIFENVCNSNAMYFNYLMGWMAQLFQEPGQKVGVAVALRGPKGVGKSKLSFWLRHIVGPRHSMVADKKEQWTGRFSKQLECLILLACEEALFAGSHEQDSTMKHLITDEDFSYEAKGKDIESGKNYLRIIITSNENWTVPATPGERRYFVLDVGRKHIKDNAYFAAIDDQMREGGAAAMLYDLLQFDYSHINLRTPPETDALKDQIETGLRGEMAWLASCLNEGYFSFLDDSKDAIEWPDRLKNPTKAEEIANEEARYILKSDVRKSYSDFVVGYRDQPKTESAVGKFFSKHIPDIEGVRKRVQEIKGTRNGNGKLKPHYHLPFLSDAREAFLAANPGLTFAAAEREIVEMGDELKATEEVADLLSSVVPLRRKLRF